MIPMGQVDQHSLECAAKHKPRKFQNSSGQSKKDMFGPPGGTNNFISADAFTNEIER